MLMLETIPDSERDASGSISLERLERHHTEVTSMYKWTFSSAKDDLAKAIEKLTA